MKSCSIAIKSSPITVKSSRIAIKSSPIASKSSPITSKSSPIAIKSSPNAIRSSLIEIKSSPIEIKSSPIAIKSSPRHSRLRRFERHISKHIPARRIRKDLRIGRPKRRSRRATCRRCTRTPERHWHHIKVVFRPPMAMLSSQIMTMF